MPNNIIEGKFEGLSINYVCWKWVLQTANCCKLVCTLEVYISKGGGRISLTLQEDSFLWLVWYCSQLLKTLLVTGSDAPLTKQMLFWKHCINLKF